MLRPSSRAIRRSRPISASTRVTCPPVQLTRRCKPTKGVSVLGSSESRHYFSFDLLPCPQPFAVERPPVLPRAAGFRFQARSTTAATPRAAGGSSRQSSTAALRSGSPLPWLRCVGVHPSGSARWHVPAARGRTRRCRPTRGTERSCSVGSSVPTLRAHSSAPPARAAERPPVLPRAAGFRFLPRSTTAATPRPAGGGSRQSSASALRSGSPLPGLRHVGVRPLRLRALARPGRAQ